MEFPFPDRRQRRLVYQVCTSKMNLGDDVDLEDYVQRPEKLSAAEITAVCQEAGLHAVRANRYVVLNKDFEKGRVQMSTGPWTDSGSVAAYKNTVKKSDSEYDFYQ